MGKYMIGCNYWDSASGTDMWKYWNADVVRKDLESLSKCGVKYLRVFPLWRDFQPIRKLMTFGNQFKEYVLGDKEEFLDSNPCGIDYKMIEHFREFAAIAKEYNMRLIVSIMTGWMSGRLFVPPALENKELITDSEVLMWSGRFIKGLISEIKDLDNIEMWDLGNECNSMGSIEPRTAVTRYDAVAWTMFIRNAIYSADNTRLISSGMHGLDAYEKLSSRWNINDQGEICDMLTVHPYPSPTINCDVEPYTRMRAPIIPSAQAEYYSGIGGKPCMIQEQGTFTETIGNRDMAADYMRVNLISGWANNLTGYLWWCGMEHIKLQQAPYAWILMERALGLVDVDRIPKPVGIEMKRMQELIETLPEVGPKDIDAMCVLPECNHLIVSTASYTLAKQAGFNVNIRQGLKHIPKANAYIVPSIAGWNVMNLRALNDILESVEHDGANLLVTYDGGQVTEFERMFGLKSHGISNGKPHTAKFEFGEITYNNRKDLILESIGAEVLAVNEEGNIVFSRNKFGNGYIYFLCFSVELLAANTVEGFNPEMTQPLYKIYKQFGEDLTDNYIVKTENPYIGVTQSKSEDGSYIITAINYSDKERFLEAQVKKGWKITPLYGNMENIPKCDATIMKAEKIS